MEIDQHTNMVKKKMVEVPPRRGQIKGKMFSVLVEKVMIAASFVGLGRERGGGSGSALPTPPSSSYNSDGHSDF